MKTMQKHLIAALVCACSAGASSGYAQSIVSLQPIAPIGAPAPGTPNNFSAASANASISATGTVNFIATAGASGLGIWYGSPSNLQLALLAGAAAPGAGGATFNGATFASAIATAFNSGGGAARIGVSGPTATGIWSYSAGVTTLETLGGTAAPGTTGNFAGNYSGLSYNDSGSYVFTSSISGGSPVLTLYADVGSGLVLVANNGTADAGLGRTYSSFDTLNGTCINNNNRICFEAALSGAIATNTAILSSVVPIPPAGATVVAQKGFAAPGTTFTFLAFTGSQINDNDDIVFRGTLDATAPANANTGLWHYDSTTSTQTLIALEGNAAPGTANFYGPSFEEWFTPNDGSIAFVSETVDAGAVPQGRGVWVDSDGPGAGAPELAAVVGGTALGKDGVTPLPAVTISSITQVAMNRNGDLLLRMTLSNGRVGIWTRAAGSGNPTKLFLQQTDTVYDSSRSGRVVNAITVPKAVNFTALGGGPVGRPTVYSDAKEPLAILTLDGSAAGLFSLTTSPLTFFVAANAADAAGTVGGQYESIRQAGNINENGMSAFRAFLQDGVGDTINGINQQGIWAEVPSTGGADVTLVARMGSPAPGGGVFGQLPLNPLYNDNEEVAFNADGGIGNSGLWKGTPGGLSLVQAEGVGNVSIFPGGEQFGFMRTLIAFNNASRILSALPLKLGSGTTPVTQANDSAIVRFGTSPRLIAREGELAGTGGARFDHLLIGKPLFLNNNSNSVFSAKRKLSPADGVTAANQWGIWYHNGTSRSVVAAGSIPANPQNVSGLAGVQFLRPEDPVLNEGNRIAFYSTLTGAVTANVDDSALFISNAGATPSLLARIGQTQSTGFGPAGVDPNAAFSSLSRPVIGAIGSVPQVLYRGNLVVGTGGVTASSDTGLWVHNGTSSRLAAREGNVTPDSSGTATTTVWTSFGNFTISPSGRVAFVGSLLVGTGGVTANDDNGLWAENSAGQLVLVVREGTSYDIPTAGGGTRNVTVRSIVIPGSPLGGANVYKGYNSAGFLVAHMTFTDDTTGEIVFLVP